MLVRVFTLHFDALVGGFDDTALRDFLKDKEVVSIRDHFFLRHEAPYLAILVTYSLAQPESTVPLRDTRQRQDASWRTHVTEAEVPLFNALRDWRMERSKRDGVPPYVICTNRQFAAMVQARPQSLTALASIDGFGRGKVEKYGQDILAVLARPASKPAPEPAPDGALSEPGDNTDAHTPGG